VFLVGVWETTDVACRPRPTITMFGGWTAEGGTFSAKDPIGFEGTDTNLYGYVFSDPVNGYDPDGRFSLAEQSVTVGVASTLLEIGSNLAGCTEQHIGADTALGGALVVLGANIIPTRGKFGGATAGTSLASWILSDLFPQKLPWSVPTPGFGNWAAKSRILGRVLGRWTPWVGVAILTKDAAEVVLCAAERTTR